jgi:hypothetical protein
MSAAASSRSSRHATRAASKARFAALLLAAACASQGKPTTKVEEAPFFRVPVAASPDSAVKLARFALGEVKGAIQPAKVQREVIILSTQYTRERKNGGHTQITIIAAVDRKPSRLEPVATMVELSAWGIDVEPTSTRLVGTSNPSARDLPTLTTTSPRTMSSSQQQPYRITRSDSPHWTALEDVLNALIDISTKK